MIEINRASKRLGRRTGWLADFAQTLRMSEGLRDLQITVLHETNRSQDMTTFTAS